MRGMTRREMVTRALFGGGLLGLRALASGIPATMLAHPELASAQAQSVAPGPSPQFLILSTSYLGDGLNANVPGTYEDLNIAHNPPGPTMAPTSLMLGGQSYTAAAPWATLPPQVLARTCFFHHATNTSVHSEASEVLKLNGAIVGDDMLVATLSRYLAHALSTVQTQPLCLGAATRRREYQLWWGTAAHAVATFVVAGIDRARTRRCMRWSRCATTRPSTK